MRSLLFHYKKAGLKGPYSVILIMLVFMVFLASCSRNQAPADVHHYGIKNKAGSLGVVQVYEGDNLFNIAKRYNIPMRSLIEANNIQTPYLIHAGDRLNIPKPDIYKVQPGDSYAMIARMHDASVTELVRLNKAKPPYRINPGDEVILSRSNTRTTAVAKNTSRPAASKTPHKKPTQSQRQAVAKVKKVANPPKRSGGKFDWPVRGKIISSYGPKEGGLFNDGINIAAGRGSAVRASENGVVAYAGDDLKGFGNLVLLKHSDGYVTAYAHLDKILVKRGATLSRGESLGTVGSTGSVKSPQLHFEVRRSGKPINPKQYLSGA